MGRRRVVIFLDKTRARYPAPVAEIAPMPRRVAAGHVIPGETAARS